MSRHAGVTAAKKGSFQLQKETVLRKEPIEAFTNAIEKPTDKDVSNQCK